MAAPPKREYRPFEQARSFVHTLGLTTEAQWKWWAHSKSRPDDIPMTPRHIYRTQWKTMGDWLGTGRIPNQSRVYQSFEEARAYARSLGLKDYKDWKAWTKSNAKPEDIPANPSGVYKESGWQGIGDWLGTGNIHPKDRRYRSFQQARAFVHSLGLKKSSEWGQWARSDHRPGDIPRTPNHVYRDQGWQGMGDWLGSRSVHPKNKRYRRFTQARAYVRTLGLKSHAEWAIWVKSGAKPDDIPANPYQLYGDKGWRGMGDWLGTGRIADQYRAYRTFEKAREFVRSLGLNTGNEWKAWARSKARPEDIPMAPWNTYRSKGWQGTGDWLGTGKVAASDRQWRTFEEARHFVRSLGLRGRQDWQEWLKSPNRPVDIPADPARVYKKQGWKGLGDWLGTRWTARGNLRRPFHEARGFVRSLGLQSGDEWTAWARSPARPVDIPIYPRTAYRKQGWRSMGDWLGTDCVAYQNRVYRPFEEARAFVRQKGLRNGPEWTAWMGSADRPQDIPKSPEYVYREHGWRGIGDWLGTGTIATQDRAYRPFEAARAFVHSLQIRNRNDWREWAKSEGRPGDIPANPSTIYRDDDWKGFGDWLGTGTVSTRDRVFRPFMEARAFARGLGLQGYYDWTEWAKSGERPVDIPSYPGNVYGDDGWQGMADWLGVVNLWNRHAIVAFLRSLIPILSSLDPAELYAIMRQNGLLTASREKRSTNQRLLTDIVNLASVPNPEVLAEQIADELEMTLAENSVQGGSEAAALSVDDEELTETVKPPHEDDGVALPSLDAIGILHAVDQMRELCPSADEEAVEFFVAKAVGKLWRQELAESGSVDMEALQAYPAGQYARIVRSRYEEQFQGAQMLAIPEGYQFHDNGTILPPNLMQRLVAYRLNLEKRIGNWSGTGAGKTMAAILASRVVDARLTVVVGLNNTLGGWKSEILRTFPDSTVHSKERGTLAINPGEHTYLLLNFESFQQPDSSSMVQQLVDEQYIDMVVLDEVHAVKQRDAVASKRRQVLGGLLTLATERNPDLRVLGMSATPVVNNLVEAVSLLEMVRGVRYSDLRTRPTIPNVIAMHEKLVVHGVRYKPPYAQELAVHCVELPGNDLVDALRSVGKGNVLGIEQVLMEAKLATIVANTQPGTLVYTHYVEQLVPRLHAALSNAGFQVGEFTGDDKTGLERFKRRQVDVLIGSSTLGTGIDGLQKVCNRLIIATLPWTSASYEQLIGRLYRQGSVFAHVDVIIPQVVLRDGDEVWSWDIQRRDRIVYKKTLADATVDGVIPEGVLEPESVMLGRALDVLHAWVDRLESEGPRVIERERLVIPLPEDDKRKALHAFGDFATMNARFNNAKSSTTHHRLQADPSEWYLYHTLYRDSRKSWTEVPYELFTTWLMARPHLVVGDFGCGEAQIAASIPNKVYSFDHVAINDQVITCNMAHTGLHDGILDIAIFSLSLMGTNVEDYFKEAHRLLSIDGRLRIAEPTGHWQGEKRDALLRMITSAGFERIGNIQERGQFLYIDALKA